jgi:hypothetical protein
VKAAIKTVESQYDYRFKETRWPIRQIEAKALAKLRHPLRSRRLRAFLDGTTVAS